ncbi:uncharacterized protein AMSG_08536 [Thecamonas trahens ATCC 50062]|uniref:NHL repeat containing protein n=1 Tax=Thecamonas trahens ATCC 50062 TaxID=461836 RepID=A0A0L0DKU8_THETB|nr:hypothetical protein AMSG_08536 [Thecamonas trahens ATCC 50062]KNC52666.1 hypothetical protein AMSG_08536 [Thecamonas trahens ATCC 50062]|eukprot:XP_013755216.1 hypothetical protein AMSG_08536 [Thecamonas trahens ATCC 50062]
MQVVSPPLHALPERSVAAHPLNPAIVAVSLTTGHVHLLDTDAGPNAEPLQLSSDAAFPVKRGARGIAFSPQGLEVYVAGESGVLAFAVPSLAALRAGARSSPRLIVGSLTGRNAGTLAPVPLASASGLDLQSGAEYADVPALSIVFKLIYGLAVHPCSGALYIADRGANTIYIATPPPSTAPATNEWTVRPLVARLGVTAADGPFWLNEPKGLAVSPSGNALFFSQYHAIIRLDLASLQLTRIAGTKASATAPPSAPISATIPSLLNPSGIALAGDNSILVCLYSWTVVLSVALTPDAAADGVTLDTATAGDMAVSPLPTGSVPSFSSPITVAALSTGSLAVVEHSIALRIVPGACAASDPHAHLRRPWSPVSHLAFSLAVRRTIFVVLVIARAVNPATSDYTYASHCFLPHLPNEILHLIFAHIARAQ